MRRLCLSTLAVACLTAPAWAAKPTNGLDVLVEQNMSMFDGALSACQELDAKTAARMKAEVKGLKPKLQGAMRKAFADVPEMQEMPSESDIQQAREMMEELSEAMGEAARTQGPEFCELMLDKLQEADPTALAKRARENYDEYAAIVREQQNKQQQDKQKP